MTDWRVIGRICAKLIGTKVRFRMRVIVFQQVPRHDYSRAILAADVGEDNISDIKLKGITGPKPTCVRGVAGRS